jgi:hypothetical protein
VTPVERKLAAILSADVVGYSGLMAEDEGETAHDGRHSPGRPIRDSTLTGPRSSREGARDVPSQHMAHAPN